MSNPAYYSDKSDRNQHSGGFSRTQVGQNPIVIRMDGLPEPWLRGLIPGVDPRTAPILFAFQQAREDLLKYTTGLTAEQIWARPYGFGSVGFHLRHIAGSTG